MEFSSIESVEKEEAIFYISLKAKKYVLRVLDNLVRIEIRLHDPKKIKVKNRKHFLLF